MRKVQVTKKKPSLHATILAAGEKAERVRLERDALRAHAAKLEEGIRQARAELEAGLLGTSIATLDALLKQ